MIKFAFITLIALNLLSGCSVTPPKQMMDVQSGEQFELKKAITVHQGKGRAFIQFGKAIKKSQLDHYDEHCSIEVKSLEEHDYTIHPETFTITKVRLDVMEVVKKETAQPMFAFNEFATTSDFDIASRIIADSSNDTQPTETYDAVYFYLQSPSNQNVFRLTCSGSLSNGDPMDAPRSYRPQRKQVNKILGSYGQIHP